MAAAAAADKKATDIVAFDVSDVLYITDVFLICSGSNSRQVAAIVDEVETRVKQAGAPAAHKEGEHEGRWVLIDFGDLVVHVQLEEERVNYGLERLWHDRPQVALDPEPVS
ncbi:MAG: ribosome silencing factor [Candidatus Nanopelagicales bacterium]